MQGEEEESREEGMPPTPLTPSPLGSDVCQASLRLLCSPWGLSVLSWRWPHTLAEISQITTTEIPFIAKMHK